MSKIRWQEILPQLKTTFRESYDYPHKKVTQWFPGHMNRGKILFFSHLHLLISSKLIVAHFSNI